MHDGCDIDHFPFDSIDDAVGKLLKEIAPESPFQDAPHGGMLLNLFEGTLRISRSAFPAKRSLSPFASTRQSVSRPLQPTLRLPLSDARASSEQVIAQPIVHAPSQAVSAPVFRELTLVQSSPSSRQENLQSRPRTLQGLTNRCNGRTTSRLSLVMTPRGLFLCRTFSTAGLLPLLPPPRTARLPHLGGSPFFL